MNNLLILAIITIFIYIIYDISKNKKNNNEEKNEEVIKTQIYPYEKKMILTKTEYFFYKELKKKCTPDRFTICPKIRMEDFLNVTDRKNLMKYRGYIKSRHIDFILCDKDLHILAGIELDDKSHNNKKALQTDTFKNNVFQKINIPLFRIEVGSKYEKEIENFLTLLSSEKNTNIINATEEQITEKSK